MVDRAIALSIIEGWQLIALASSRTPGNSWFRRYSSPRAIASWYRLHLSITGAGPVGLFCISELDDDGGRTDGDESRAIWSSNVAFNFLTSFIASSITLSASFGRGS